MSAVFKSGLTKIDHKVASRMSAKVFGKGVVSGFVYNFGVTTGLAVTRCNIFAE
ncbi:MAG: hypothetical protein IJS22_07030 [Lachnospiraceae bacterium]|nr:hypothetical protein [Lachnospiraceae bacterium]